MKVSPKVLLPIVVIYFLPFQLAYPQFPETKIWASELGPNDHFARSSAIDGSRILIGAVTKGTGEAYLFESSAGVWSETFNFQPTDGATQDYYSRAVDIDGNWVAIGSERHDASGTNAGAAYIYEFGTTWTLSQKIFSTDIATEDRFGTSVAVSGDVVAVGAPEDDDNGDGSGSVYVFRYNGSSWTQEAKLVASNGAAGDQFGFSLAMSGDDILVGAWEHNGGQGAAYVFHYNGTGWVEQDILEAIDGASGDQFGSWWISIDGDYAVVGALLDTNDQGSAYVFNRIGSTWSQQAKLTHTSPTNGDQFGVSASIDGDYLVVGSFGGEFANVYMRSGSTWNLIATLTASDGEPGDDFGYTSVISGMNVLVGADDDIVNGFTSGSAYIYDLDSPLAITISDFNASVANDDLVFQWHLDRYDQLSGLSIEVTDDQSNSWKQFVDIPLSAWSREVAILPAPKDFGYASFRLVARESSGHYFYSDVVNLLMASGDVGTIEGPWPNPVVTEARFRVSSRQSNLVYSIYDITGRRVLAGTLADLSEHGNVLRIDMSSLSTGLYSFTYRDGTHVRSKLVVKN